MFYKYFSTKSNDNFSFLFLEYLKKEKKIVEFKALRFKEEIKFNLIHLGKLDYSLIEYKIKSSNLILNNEINNKIKEKKEKMEYMDFNILSIKKTSKKIEYKISYINFIKNRNIFYILFTIIVCKVVEVSIIYVFEGKIFNYFIFYEIFVQDFFSFMHRVLNEIQVFETYLYSTDCIIPKAIIQSINISIFKKFIDKSSIKYI